MDIENNNTQESVDTPVDELRKEKNDLINFIAFARALKIPFNVPNNPSTQPTVSFSKYTQADILRYLQNPSRSASNLRKASIAMFDGSTQYRRLIEYMAGLFLYQYTISPAQFDGEKDFAAISKAYQKVCKKLKQINVPALCHLISVTAIKEGVFYGVIWENDSSFYVQKLDHQMCSICGIENGVYRYSVDMSKVKESRLGCYPPAFQELYEDYRSGSGNKEQIIPSEASLCIKFDESTIEYSIPPFSSAMPLLYSIETYKQLQEDSTRIGNYKLIGMKIPTRDDGVPKFDWEIADKYYDQLVSQLPDFVGASISPMDLNPISFDRSSSLDTADLVSKAEQQYWVNTGVSPLINGGGSDTAGVLKMSVKSDESFVWSLILQIQNAINQLLSRIPGTIKFEINILPATRFNHSDMLSAYREAATLGVPGSAAAYAVLSGVRQEDIIGAMTIENDVLMKSGWEPLKSSYTTSNKSNEKDEEDLTESGTRSRDSGVVDNR